jgi:hypothetical protein
VAPNGLSLAACAIGVRVAAAKAEPTAMETRFCFFMIFSVEVEVDASVFLTHPGTRRNAQKLELLFHPPAANADRQMQTKLNAFP